ncbi:MAG TPA: histidinol dehydrogenase, partial [Actinomycetota bacterium]|nr:histidinol dehydrogenase [Actinomycetota bacterium]
MSEQLLVVDLRGRPVELAPRRLEVDPDLVRAVREIVARVRAEGDAALHDLTARFDGADLRARGLFASPEEIEAALGATDPELARAIDRMAERVADLHARQLPREWWAEGPGYRFGEVVRPLRRVGCYVPGGRAAYPSTVVMTVVPARVAGVEEVVVATPPRPDGSLPATVLYAARRAGATEVLKVGGAQAVAALAYGTESVRPVDKVVGPGNLYVTLAKREVAGDVGIDGLAGPSELVVVADSSADPLLVAADLLAQAEHDPLAAATLVTTDPELPGAVARALEAELARADRGDVVRAALRQARAVLVEDEAAAARAVDALAPEHLQVVLARPEPFLGRVRNAGAVFLGPASAVPFGDYGVGSNHVLPTMGSARFSSGLRASDFVTVRAVVALSAEGSGRLAPEVARLARAEGLPGHARAVELRAAAPAAATGATA